MYQAIIGYGILAVMMVMILKKKATAAFCFAMLPVIGAVLCGFGAKDILGFVNTGGNHHVENGHPLYFLGMLFQYHE